MAKKHLGQIIKRSGKPYLDHLIAVGEMAMPYVSWGFEAGLCHDLLEKTETTADELNKALLKFGYEINDVLIIVERVVELTDVFTKSAYPELKKSERKSKEEERLLDISAGAKTVKYADMIYNIQWMILYEPKHLKKYLKRKLSWLNKMMEGDPTLHHKAIELIRDNL